MHLGFISAEESVLKAARSPNLPAARIVMSIGQLLAMEARNGSGSPTSTMATGQSPTTSTRTRSGRVYVYHRDWLLSDTVASAQASTNLLATGKMRKAERRRPHRYLVRLFTKLPLVTAAEDYAAPMPLTKL